MTASHIVGAMTMAGGLFIAAVVYRSLKIGQYRTAVFAVDRDDRPRIFWSLVVGYFIFGALIFLLGVSLFFGNSV